MNKYGRTAQENWTRLVPSQLEQIPHPQEFFTTLGEDAMNQIQSLQMRLAGADSPSETYLEKVGRLNAARAQAEEVVTQQLLTPPREEWEEPAEEETPDETFQVLQGMRQAARDLDEME